MARARRCSMTLVMAIITTLCACSLACGAHHALALDAETPNVIESTAADQPASASETGTQNTPAIDDSPASDGDEGIDGETSNSAESAAASGPAANESGIQGGSLSSDEVPENSSTTNSEGAEAPSNPSADADTGDSTSAAALSATQSGSTFTLSNTNSSYDATSDRGTYTFETQLLETTTFTSEQKTALGYADVDPLVATGTYLPQSQGTFYILLPTGVFADVASVTARSVWNGAGVDTALPPESVQATMAENWHGTGRTMLAVHVQAGPQNYTLDEMSATSGFTLTFAAYSTDASSNQGEAARTAYMSGNPQLAGGMADNGDELLIDVNDDANPEGTAANVVYAQAVLSAPTVTEVLAYVDADAAITPTVTTQSAADDQNLASLTANAANKWQVESGAYEGNDSANKTASPDGAVRVQKNVVPTGVENEFLVYLSVDYKAAFSSYFETADYEATESNKNHAEKVGTIVTSMEGAKDVKVSGKTSYVNSAYFTIVNPSGETLAENVKIYWSKANNVTFYLKIDDSHYMLFGVNVKKDGTNQVALSQEAWELIRQDAVKTALNSVTDVMGDDIEFVETVQADGTTSYDADSKTLTWTPEVKASPETQTVTSGGTTSTWYLNAAELVYKVRLNPSASAGLSEDGAKVGSETVSNVNTHATLTYNNSSTIDFPVPQVKGLLYDLVFTKVAGDTGAALPGAVFQLQKQQDDGIWTNVEGKTATSDENGLVSFSGLTWGTYRAVETQAPFGYKNTDSTGANLTWTSSSPLCWTTSSSGLTRSSLDSTHVISRESDGPAQLSDPLVTNFMVLKQDENGDPLENVEFTLADASEEAITRKTVEMTVVRDGARQTVAAADFGELKPGTYTLTESRVVAGYTKHDPANGTAASAGTYQIVVSNTGITITDSSGNQAPLNKLVDGSDTTAYFYTTVTNYALPSLPATGGKGGTVAYAAGTLALAGGAAILLRWRMARGSYRR